MCRCHQGWWQRRACVLLRSFGSSVSRPTGCPSCCPRPLHTFPAGDPAARVARTQGTSSPGALSHVAAEEEVRRPSKTTMSFMDQHASPNCQQFRINSDLFELTATFKANPSPMVATPPTSPVRSTRRRRRSAAAARATSSSSTARSSPATTPSWTPRAVLASATATSDHAF